MKVPLLNWGEQPVISEEDHISKVSHPFLWRVPNRDLTELALELEQLDGEKKPTGLLPPFDPGNLAVTARALAMCFDFFHPIPVYACVTSDLTARNTIRTFRGGAYKHFCLRWPGAARWPSFAPTVLDLLEKKVVHVAGGDPAQPGWTWSTERI